MGYRRLFYDIMNSGDATQGLGLVEGHGAGIMNRSRWVGRKVGPGAAALARHASITHNHDRTITTSLSRTRLGT